jgi:hypothetical protein
MLIEIRCGNFSNFDASLGRYVECEEKLIVSNDQLGSTITCTKCHQPVEVPYDADTQILSTETRPESEPESVAKPTKSSNKSKGQSKIQNKADRSRKPDGNSKKSARSKSAPAPSTAARKSKRTSPTQGDPKNRVAKKRPAKKETRKSNKMGSKDVMSMDFNGQPIQSNLDVDRKERCKKCGNISIEGKCTVCRFVEPKFEKLYQPLDDVKIELAGFQRWFSRTMSEGVSMKLVEWASHIMLGLLGILLLVAAAVCIAGLGPGPIFGVILMLLILGIAGLYISFVFKGHQFLRDPNAKLAWFQKPFWNMVLAMARFQKWEKYDGKLKDRRIIKVRDSSFRDPEIPQLEGFKTCQVLDLQGTAVTDTGLLDLYDLKHLQCVVLKQTNVTHQGVFRLQQSFPRLWIWY